MKMNFKRYGAAALVVLLPFSMLGLVGCEQATQEVEEPEEVEVVVEEKLRVLGKETNTALMIKIENSTGKKISEIAIKTTVDEEYAESLEIKEAEVVMNERVLLCFEPLDLVTEPAAESTTAQPEQEGVASEPAAEGVASEPQEEKAGAQDEKEVLDVVLRTLYDVRVVFFDETSLELHGLNLAELEEATIRISSDRIGYISYPGLEGEIETTLASERELLAEKARIKAEIEAAEIAAAEAAAAEAAAAEAAKQRSYRSSGNSSSGSRGRQSQNQCVDDLVLG